MRWPKWTSSSWRYQAFSLLTAVLIVCIASNPELAPFVPVLDALGLDVLLYLLVARGNMVAGEVLLPFARHAYQQWGRRAARCALHAVRFSVGGYLRQLLWHMKQTGAVFTLVGPTRSKLSLFRKLA